jgi:4-amino-4-deoxy-L-arabinose transferase-like glycosyltransferase
MEEARGGHQVALSRRALAAIVVLGALARAWGLWFGLPHTQARPDESVVAQIAIGFWKGTLNPGFFDYPTLFMYVLAAADLAYYVAGRLSGAFHSVPDFLASWTTHWTPFYLIGRSIVAIAGTATIVVVARIAARLGGTAAGLIAGAFLALSFLHVRDSHFAVTDVPATLLICLSIDRLLRAHVNREPQQFFVAGVLAGLAVTTKYNAAFLVIPLAASALVELVDARWEGRRSAAGQRLWLFLLPCAVVFLWGTPYALLAPAGLRQGIGNVSAHLREGHGLDPGNGWVYHLTVSLRYGVGWPVVAAALAGMALLSRRNLRLALLVCTFPLAYYAMAGSGRTVFVRYVIPIVPFLCVTAALAVEACGRALTRLAGLGPRASAVATAALAAACIAPSAVNVARLDYVLGHTDNRLLVADWIRERVPPSASLHQSSGSAFGALEVDAPGQPVPQIWNYDEAANRFTRNGRPQEGKPDWIVIQQSPLVLYSRVPPAILNLVATDEYALIRSFQAARPSRRRVFDQQDAFFLPLDGFAGIDRPGPDFDVYRRTRQGATR